MNEQSENVNAVKRCCATCRHIVPSVEATWAQENGDIGPHFAYRHDYAPCWMGYIEKPGRYNCGSFKVPVKAFFYQPEFEGTLCDLWEVR